MVHRIEKAEGVKTVVPIGQNTVSTDDNNTGSRLIDGVNYDEYADVVGIQYHRRPQRLRKPAPKRSSIPAGKNKKNSRSVTSSRFTRGSLRSSAHTSRRPARASKFRLATMQDQLGGEGKATAFLVKINDGFTPEQVGEKLQQQFPENQILLDQRPRRALYAGHSGAQRFSKRHHRCRRVDQRAGDPADDVHDRHRADTADRHHEIARDEQRRRSAGRSPRKRC